MAWNRPKENGEAVSRPLQKRSGNRFPIRSVIAGAVVVLGAAVAEWRPWSGDESVGETPPPRSARQIKEVKSAAEAKQVAVTEKPVDPYEAYDHETQYRDKDGILRFKDGNCRAPDPTRPVMVQPHPGRWTHEVFKHPSEDAIAQLLKAKPGETRLLSTDFSDPAFLADFKDSLKEEIVINETDRLREKQIKQAVIETKKEIEQRLAAGEKLGDILSDAAKEINRLAAYRKNVRKMVLDAVKNGNFSDADVRDCVAAANKMLEENGANPIKADEFIEWNLRLSAERKTAEEAKEEKQ